jgi:hypothetical protein
MLNLQELSRILTVAKPSGKDHRCAVRSVCVREQPTVAGSHDCIARLQWLGQGDQGNDERETAQL